MARTRNVHVLDVNVGDEANRAFGQLKNAQGFSGRAQARMGERMRDALRAALQRTVEESDFPVRTGRAKNIARNGVRVFGTTFNSLRGHILAPGYIALQEHGGEINPENGPLLAIPFGQAVRPDGTPKLPGPRAWANILPTFVYKSKKTGGLYIAYKSDGGESIEVLYVLVEMVQVTGKHFLADEWERQSEYLVREFGEIMLDEIAQVDLGKLARVTTKSASKARIGK